MIETVYTCPLGSTCTKVVGDKIEQCMWYVELEGTNPQTGKPAKDSKCAIAWQPILMIEGNGVNHNISSSIQSLRNETVKRQNLALEAINVKNVENK